MELLYKQHRQYLSNVSIGFRRDLIDEIDWNEQLVGIQGPKGVGKSTLILQHIQEEFGNSNLALYISMDNLALKKYTLLEIAEYHYQNGGKYLFVDEIHKLENWSIELKTIYDLFPKLKIAFTGSSMLNIYAGQADLSRRAIIYNMFGLSFREFINIEQKTDIKKCSLDDILNNHIDIADKVNSQINILPLFKEYLQYGYYPFYLKGKKSYWLKLNNIIANTIEVDMPLILKTDIHNINKLQKLLLKIAYEVPFEPNMASLSSALELNKATTNQYLYFLEKAGLLKLLQSNEKSYSLISKPEKIYLDNTNLAFSLSPENPNVGNIRETFFFNQVNHVHQVNYSKKGDFLVNNKYTFEIGGAKKTYKQIAELPDSFLVSDDISSGLKNKIPLWLFGWLM